MNYPPHLLLSDIMRSLGELSSSKIVHCNFEIAKLIVVNDPLYQFCFLCIISSAELREYNMHQELERIYSSDVNSQSSWIYSVNELVNDWHNIQIRKMLIVGLLNETACIWTILPETKKIVDSRLHV
jgi:hypothetical protein